MFTFSLTLVRHGETLYNKEKLLQGQGVDTSLSEAGMQQGEVVGRYLRDIPFNNVFVSNLQRAVQVDGKKYNLNSVRVRMLCKLLTKKKTAELILKNNTYCSGTEMVLEPLLRERGFGVCEGHPKEHMKNMANAAGQSCRDFTPPGGETLDQVRLRFKKFLKVLFKKMLDEHSCAEAPEASNGPLASAAAASDAAPVGSADDGLQGVSIHVLVVSHGAYIRIASKHLVEDLNSSLPAGVKISQLFAPCPNTGISRYILTLSRSESGSPVLSAARCVFTNRKSHLDNLTAAE